MIGLSDPWLHATLPCYYFPIIDLKHCIGFFYEFSLNSIEFMAKNASIARGPQIVSEFHLIVVTSGTFFLSQWDTYTYYVINLRIEKSN